jgi:ABC-type transporter Mla subunit MlaD
MAPQLQHGLKELANRLNDFADAIENPGAHEAEQDIRRAAKLLGELVDPTPLLPRLMAEIKQVAGRCRDAEASASLRALLGEA